MKNINIFLKLTRLSKETKFKIENQDEKNSNF
jgi:hypothetical protein